jgi:hypothetical protein
MHNRSAVPVRLRLGSVEICRISSQRQLPEAFSTAFASTREPSFVFGHFAPIAWDSSRPHESNNLTFLSRSGFMRMAPAFTAKDVEKFECRERIVVGLNCYPPAIQPGIDDPPPPLL